MPSERLNESDLLEIERYCDADFSPFAAKGPSGKILSLVAEVRASRELLAELEWKQTDMEGERVCPLCEGRKHKPDCKLAALLGREER